jgi:hypothetical protein
VTDSSSSSSSSSTPDLVSDCGLPWQANIMQVSDGGGDGDAGKDARDSCGTGIGGDDDENAHERRPITPTNQHE